MKFVKVIFVFDEKRVELTKAQILEYLHRQEVPALLNLIMLLIHDFVKERASQ